MSSVVISGDTSGAITVAAPAVAGSNTITLPAVTGTAVVAGQNSAITAGTVNGGAANPLASGTTVDFTSIPSWVKRITVMLSGVSTSGSSNLQIQIGSSSFTTSGYLGSVQVSASILAYTTGFGISFNHVNTANLYGVYCIQLLTGNTWVSTGMNSRSNDNGITVSSGSLALGGTLDRLRITTVSPGTDTFDAGSINILYE